MGDFRKNKPPKANEKYISITTNLGTTAVIKLAAIAAVFIRENGERVVALPAVGKDGGAEFIVTSAEVEKYLLK